MSMSGSTEIIGRRQESGDRSQESEVRVRGAEYGGERGQTLPRCILSALRAYPVSSEVRGSIFAVRMLQAMLPRFTKEISKAGNATRAPKRTLKRAGTTRARLRRLALADFRFSFLCKGCREHLGNPLGTCSYQTLLMARTSKRRGVAPDARRRQLSQGWRTWQVPQP